MKATSFSQAPARLLPGLFALVALIGASPLAAQQVPPAGDLKVTVQELENGDVRFTLSGTSFLGPFPEDTSPEMSTTNFSLNPPTPPADSTTTFLLPPGLILTVPDHSIREESEPEGPQEAAPGFLDKQVLDVQFPKAYWTLGHEVFEAQTLRFGDSITGSGTVTTSNIPFSLFEPGTYQVGRQSILDASVEEAQSEILIEGTLKYVITYEVIPFIPGPFTPAPSLRVSTPRQFPDTRLHRSGGSQNIRITNSGNQTLENLTTALSGAAAGDFSHSSLPVSRLAPGASTVISVDFRPTQKGIRRAFLTASGTAQVIQPSLTSEEETAPENVESESMPTVTVSDTVEVIGKGIAIKKLKAKPRGKRKLKLNSPRFPRLFLGTGN